MFYKSMFYKSSPVQSIVCKSSPVQSIVCNSSPVQGPVHVLQHAVNWRVHGQGAIIANFLFYLAGMAVIIAPFLREVQT